jgi:hypothetical protein
VNLSEEKLAELGQQHKKVIAIDWDGHQVVLRRPTRDECRAYRVALETPSTKADAADQLCQQTIVAFDGETQVTPARVAFTSSFLVEYPMFTSTRRAQAAIAVLAGIVESEDAADLGKALRVWPAPQPRMPTV